MLGGTRERERVYALPTFESTYVSTAALHPPVRSHSSPVLVTYSET